MAKGKLRRGKLITLEGPDGAGKSTMVHEIMQELKNNGYDAIITREPGGTPIAEACRNIVLGVTEEKMCIMTEMLLFAAARAQHMHALILPALEAGKVVVCDRFADSTYAYQGAGRNHRSESLELEEFVLKGFEPDYTLFFNITLEESKRRLNFRSSGEINHLDLEADKFKEDVYNGYMLRYYQNLHRMTMIDSMQPMTHVATDVANWVNTTFTKENKLIYF
jgi:dTMP kinase